MLAAKAMERAVPLWGGPAQAASSPEASQRTRGGQGPATEFRGVVKRRRGGQGLDTEFDRLDEFVLEQLPTIGVYLRPTRHRSTPAEPYLGHPQGL